MSGQTWPSQGDKLRGAPTQLFEEILAQKELCNQVLRSKNNLIEMLEVENRVVDEGYKVLIGEYHTNISVLSGRMEYHMHSFSKLLESERLNLEVAFSQQKGQQLAKGEEGWQAAQDSSNGKKDQTNSNTASRYPHCRVCLQLPRRHVIHSSSSSSCTGGGSSSSSSSNSR